MRTFAVFCVFAGFLFAISTYGGATNQPVIDRKAGSLYEIVRRASEHQVARNSDRFRTASPAELHAWRTIVEQVLNGRLNDAARTIEKYSFPYRVTLFTDKTSGREYILLEEDLPIRNGWGLYLFDLHTTSPLVLEVPHPVFDGNTEFQGIEAFLQTKARAYLLAGAHRRANFEASSCTQPSSADGDATYPVSDVAHSVVAPFHAVHESLARLKPDSVAVQLHGMQQRTICPNVFLSTGTATVTSNSKRLLACLVKRGVEAQVYDGKTACPLTALSNVQGRFSNGVTSDPCRKPAATSPEPGAFIHIEQEPGIRRDRKSWQPVINALKCAFPADENPLATI